MKKAFYRIGFRVFHFFLDTLARVEFDANNVPHSHRTYR
jgi:hypothetical protein